MSTGNQLSCLYMTHMCQYVTSRPTHVHFCTQHNSAHYCIDIYLTDLNQNKEYCKYNTTFSKYQQPSEQFHVTEEMPSSLAKCPNESAQSQCLQCQPFAWLFARTEFFRLAEIICLSRKKNSLNIRTIIVFTLLIPSLEIKISLHDPNNYHI
jgi:hypothetical protein